MIQSKKYTAGSSQNHVDIYQQKMIAMVNQIKKGCIMGTSKNPDILTAFVKEAKKI